LAKASTELGLGDYLRFGRGEEKSGGRRKRALLADVFEAVTGAIFLDGGLSAATEFVERALGQELRAANPVSAAAADPKTMLQERLQAAHQPGPQYTVIETLGPPHRRVFHVELKWNGGSTRGEGQTIKAAEKEIVIRSSSHDPNGRLLASSVKAEPAGPPKSVFREYFESAVVTVIMALFGMTFIVQAVKVPTGSMQNTITIGDHLLVNKF